MRPLQDRTEYLEFGTKKNLKTRASKLYRKDNKKQEKIDAMGLATLRRRPALSVKIPRAVGILTSILVPYAPKLKKKIPS